MAPTFKDVYGEKYLLLTTFTKDGRPKPTPVWGVPAGDKLLISTDDGSWKTKRINNTPRVTIQKCGRLGKPKGDPVEAVARNLAKSETRPVFDMVTRRYWWHAWWWVPQALLRGGIDKVHAAIEVEAPSPEGRSEATREVSSEGRSEATREVSPEGRSRSEATGESSEAD
jgi:PPOX class probable F420-dependent enzyme